MTRFSVSPRLARASVLGSASLLLVAACSSGDGTRDADGNRPALIRVGEARAQLTRVDSCGALLTSIQDNLVAQLEQRGRDLRDGALNGGTGTSGGVAVDQPELGGLPGPTRGDDGAAAPAGTGSPPPSATPTPGNPSTPTDNNSAGEAPSGSGGAGGTASGGGDFSGTTVQVKDVDEADILKAEGDRLFLLHGGTLFVLQAWPATSTEILGSKLLEGQPTEMFIRDGKAVVFSTVYGPSGIQPANGVVPYDYYYPSWGFTKITVLDVSGDAPSVLRESYVEGGYVSSRRHDGLVRAVIQDGFKVPSIGYPNIETYDPFGNRYAQADIDEQVNAWLDRVERSIRAADLSDFLPREFTRTNGVLVAEPTRCESYYAPDPGLTQSGVTQVVALDLEAPTAPLSGATILGNAERIYANEDVLLVTQSDYRWQLGTTASEQTVIHRFDIDGPRTSYTASGFIAGTINDQFSLDELDGVIRVSTTENRFGRGDIAVAPTPTPGPGSGGAATIAPAFNGPVNRVVTLGSEGDDLVQLGATEDFGLTERIYSTRFIGDKGYVVTFRQTDPFFVVDLADPKDPHIVGELKIPGFSNFLFPLGPDHLFAIGQEANAQGFVQGLALQIFDVSDPTNPVLASPKYVFPEQGASLANVDHRAITFHPDQDLVSFPYQSYETGESRLEIFNVSATEGISRLGDMGANVTPPSLNECLQRMGYSTDPATLAQIDANPEWRASLLRDCQSYYYGPQFRRGVFRDDVVYGITTAGVYAYPLDALSGMPIGQVSLPSEVYDQGTGPGYAEPGTVSPPIAPSAPPTMGGAAGAGSAGAGSGGAASTTDEKPVDE
jgi:beta propeller domain-containing protein